ncbi:MAG: hypothetical protein RLZZ165_1837 [Bacteroidota bacterium]
MRPSPQKILVIRLSSIGDIVLTSPVIRCLRHCFPEAAIHFLTKKAFGSLLQYNPHLDQVHLFEGDLGATVAELKAEKFDHIIDLHNSLRSRWVRLRLQVSSTVYTKDRWAVLLHTKLGVGRLPAVHTVQRYERAIKALGCKLDGAGLEFHLPEESRSRARELIGRSLPAAPVAMVIAGTHFTKRWPKEYFVELINALGQPVALLGGPAEAADAGWIAKRLKVDCLNAVAQCDLLLSAAILEQSRFVVTHDTGLMHIATALGKTIYSLWGNTVPELGFAPYRPQESVCIQIEGLHCRPCTKLGYEKCPRGHFKCMRDLTPSMVQAKIQAARP